MQGDNLAVFAEDFKSVLQALNEQAHVVHEISEKLGPIVTAKASVSKRETAPAEGLEELERLSAAEVVKWSGAKMETDKVFLLAFYLFKSRKMPVFNSRDINAIIAEARLEQPKNLSQTISNLVRGGRLRQAEEKENLKAYTITTTGEEEAKALLSAKQES